MTTREMPSASVVEVAGVVAGYGDLRVLQGVDLTLSAGTVEVVLGRNGVGKTTLMSAISGLVPFWTGRLTLDGKDITKEPTYRRATAGIALVQEGKRIFHRRTVLENISLGCFSKRMKRAERRAHMDQLLERFPILQERQGQLAGSLSGGQQQMLAIAQALASSPRVLLLDEPSAGLAPAIVDEVFDHVRALADEGLTILLVEQLAERALGLADHVTVMDRGRVVASGPPSDFTDLQSLQEAYLGSRRAVTAAT